MLFFVVHGVALDDQPVEEEHRQPHQTARKPGGKLPGSPDQAAADDRAQQGDDPPDNRFGADKSQM